MLGTAGAEDEPVTRVKPEYTEDIKTLGPETTRVKVRYHKGLFAKLVRQCPRLVELVVLEHSTLSLDDLRALSGLETLRSLSVSGDLTIDAGDLKALGTLTQLRALNLAIG
jgi:hypothetical protein